MDHTDPTYNENGSGNDDTGSSDDIVIPPDEGSIIDDHADPTYGNGG